MRSNLKDISNDYKPVLDEFSADWNGTCELLAAILKDVKTGMRDQVKIVKRDVDLNQELAGK